MGNSRKFTLPACLSTKGQSGGRPRCPQAVGSTHRHTQTCAHTCSHICIHAHVHTCIHICIHAHVHTHVQICTHACAHTYTHAHVRTSSHLPFWKVGHPDSPLTLEHNGVFYSKPFVPRLAAGGTGCCTAPTLRAAWKAFHSRRLQLRGLSTLRSLGTAMVGISGSDSTGKHALTRLPTVF